MTEPGPPRRRWRSDIGQKVEIKLEFFTPFEATNQTTLSIRPDGAGSRVVWNMVAFPDFKMKAAGLFMNMDQMVGADFERGLQELKKLAEAAPATPTQTTATTTQP